MIQLLSFNHRAQDSVEKCAYRYEDWGYPWIRTRIGLSSDTAPNPRL